MQGSQQRPHKIISDVFAEERATEHGFVRASAPMVRYSKLEFRRLLRKNGVKLSFTPMIIADSFNNSQKARENEFTTCPDDNPVIAQFAASKAHEFVKAAQLIYPFVDGIDLNCGCPQSWAIAKGFGCGLLRNPELIRDIIQTVRRTLPQDFSISLKLRLLNGDSVRPTVELARQLEKCGATFLSLHGRTMWQRTSDPLNIPAMIEVKKSLISTPLIVNGNVRSWDDACELHKKTNSDGVMAARGLLANPALFNPIYKDEVKTPLECIRQWLDIATRADENINFQSFHHHLTFMCSGYIKRKMRLDFNNFTKKNEIFNFFDERFSLRPSQYAIDNPFHYSKCDYTHCSPNQPKKDPTSKDDVWCEYNNGSFYNDFRRENDVEQGESCFKLESSFFAEL